MWEVPELTAVVTRGQTKSLHQHCRWLAHLESHSFLLEFLLYLGKQKRPKRKTCLEKEGENLSGSQTVRAEHAEGEGRGLLHCVIVLSKQDELFKTEHAPPLYHTLLPAWKRHLLREWKTSLKSRIKLSLWELLGAQLHPDLPSTLSGKLKSPKEIFAKPWNWVFTKVCGLLASQAWSSTSSRAAGFLSRYHCHASHWQPCAEVSSFLLKLPLVAVIVGICPLGWTYTQASKH